VSLEKNVGVVMPLTELRGGGEMMLLHLMQQGRGKGIRWSVVFFGEGPLVERVRALGVTVHVVPAGRFRDLPKYFGWVSAVTRIARAEKWDLVLSWMTIPHLYGGMVAWRCRIPAIWYQLGSGAPEGLADRLSAYLPAKLIMACSVQTAAEQAKIPPHRPTRPVHPGVELERFDPTTLPTPQEARAKLGLPATGALIGMTGRLQRWKGMHTLIAAMPDILKRYPDAHAVIVGGQHDDEPEYPPFLENQIAMLGLTEKVRMVGLQSNVQEWVQAMDVCVHASNHEPFGIVSVEAMALGKPVVAADSGGPREIITEGKDGFLTPYDNAPRLAEAILRYLDDPEQAARMGAAAQVRAQDFSTVRYADAIIACCQEAWSSG
jgi:glycosyltransferase involved in cell wall biosynthesis